MDCLKQRHSIHSSILQTNASTRWYNPYNSTLVIRSSDPVDLASQMAIRGGSLYHHHHIGLYISRQRTRQLLLLVPDVGVVDLVQNPAWSIPAKGCFRFDLPDLICFDKLCDFSRLSFDLLYNINSDFLFFSNILSFCEVDWFILVFYWC